ncbi:hypothetical protein Tco_1078125 [Tanacetum coccineum]
MNGEDVTDHIARVLEITEWIKIPNVEKNVLRLHVFSKSLSGDAKKWWNDEIEGKAIGWNETCNKFCHKYYSLSHSSNSKVLDDLDNDTDYLEFFYWLALKFDNYWEIDKNTQNGLWEFYVNERTKGAMGDLDDEPRNESYKKECSDTTKEFIVVRHSIRNDEEFVTVSPSKICAIERTPGSMSCIYHELFSRKDHGWEVLAVNETDFNV